MIIVRLFGGLGNQLFQYAAGRRIAHTNNTALKLDISWFEKESNRKYKLNKFNIIGDVASNQEIAKLKKLGNNLVDITSRSVEWLKPYYKRTLIKERFYHFDSHILDVGSNAYLDGYWQSERYFNDIPDIIRREFTLKTGIDNVNKPNYRLITSMNSVSIHVRRGDYVSDKKVNEFHGICSIEYYHKAIEQITKVISEPSFFVFSDDPTWVKDNLNIPYPTTVITNNGIDNDYEDLRLMSLCKHHIIANSSFSWWGAWLSTDREKIVIAPSKWFNNTDMDTCDLIPNSWVRI